MNFLVDINPDMKPIEYNMTLCKLNEQPIMTIKNIRGLSYKGEFINIDELSFEVPLYRMDSDGTQIKNERYEAIKGDMLILLNDTKFFYTHYVNEQVSQDGSIYKEVQAYSREYELSQKILSGYSGLSRKIYDNTNSKDENGLEIGFLNYVEKISSWRVGYISPKVLLKFRALEFPNSNLLQSFQEVQQTFGCIFDYDTLNKIINIYEIEELGSNQGLHISDKNFLQTLQKTIKSDEIKTRLHLFGKDNISIQRLSIFGQDYIDNLDFYKNTEYMSQELIDALNNYDTYVLTKKGLFDGYLAQLNTKNTELGIRNDELVALRTQLKIIQSNLDVAISSGQATDTYKTQETAKLTEISTKLSQVIALQNSIKVINDSINAISIDTDISTHLMPEQIRELDSFIREDTFSDTNYTEDNLDELLAEGRKILNRISQPAVQFSIGVVDFLSVVECQHEWGKFVKGDIVRLYHEELNFDYEVRFVGYTHSPDNNSLDMKFSNTNSMDDSNLYMRDLLADLKTTSATVDFSRDKWNKSEQASSLIADYIDSALDLSKQQILKAEGLEPIVDDRGIWLYKVNPDNSIDPKQMRLINNVLAITNDGWNTVSTAISGDGINANLIRGKLGEFAEIRASQILVSDTERLDGVITTLTNANGEIIQRVSGVEGVNGGLNTRLTSAESKITPSAITATVQDNTTTLASKLEVSQTASAWTATFNSLKNLDSGQQLAGGITTIDRNGVKVAHAGLGGQYSQMRADGFMRKWEYGEARYLNDIYIAKFYEEGDSLGDAKPNPYRITLPQSFRGRTNVQITVVPLSFRFTIGYMSSSGVVSIHPRRIDISAKVSVISRTTGQESKDLNAINPWVDIDVYGYVQTRDTTEGYVYEYMGIDWMLLVLGY